MKIRSTALFFFMAMTLWMACKEPAAENATTTSSAADTSSTKAPPMDSAAMMKAWEAFMTPGDMHAFLAKFDGTWDVEVLSFMDPSSPPHKSSATQVYASIMNGLYHTNTFNGNIMGMPFEGRGIMGYDNSKKMFVSSWIDNLGSGIMMMTGHWDDASKTLHLKGTQTDPVTAQDSPVREELKVVDDNTHILTMYGQGMDGKETKFMEATFKRKM